jgi:glycosyltransferase involved in cell wall biosynthesis
MQLDKHLFTPAVCCIHFKGELAWELERYGIRIFNLNSRKPDYFAFKKIISVIDEFKPLIVHTHNINASIDGVIASVIRNTPVKIHTDHARRFPDKLRYMFAERIVFGFVNRIIAVTEETKKNLIRFEKIPGKKIQVIHNGISGIAPSTKSQNELTRKELGLTQYQFIIGTVARLEMQKGLIYLIRAFPQILRGFPDSCLLITGQGSQYETLRMEAKILGIEKNVKLTGPKLEVGQIFNILDIYVLPSVWEGLPISLLEAMSSQRPIVATQVGGIPQVITDGESGILIPPACESSIALAVCALLKDSSLRTRLAQGARRRFEKEFTAARMVKAHQSIYLNCLCQKRIVNANTCVGW